MNRLWYSRKHVGQSPDTIHQVLVFGTLEEIRFLKQKAGEKNIRDLFLNYPKKIYTSASLNFIKNFVLHITRSIDEQNYLKNAPRHIR